MANFLNVAWEKWIYMDGTAIVSSIADGWQSLRGA